MKLYFSIIKIILSITTLTLYISCSSSKVEKSLTAEEHFELGMNEFNDENYLEAINEFTVITLQFPGSAVSDDAQFYLGECRFMREEYLLASYEYEVLKKNMPASPLVPQAQYKIALCNYQLSPKYSLDQSFALKAIDEFQAFIEYFPADTLVPNAETKIYELRDRLAEKEYQTAVLYMKMEYYKAATIYFDNVLENFHDSQYAEKSYVGKIEALMKRKKREEAFAEAEKLFSRYPNTTYRGKIDSLLKGSL